MPEYDWECPTCKHCFIVECKIPERNNPNKCPKCDADATRCEVPKKVPIFRLAGGSWHRNGYEGVHGLRKNDKRKK
jgi:hypothetical protein